MTINASEIPSVVAVSQAQINAKAKIRAVIVKDLHPLFACFEALGNDPILCQDNPDLNKQLQHVDLTKYYPQISQAIDLLSQAYDVLGTMHNETTAHGIEVGIVMDAPNGTGGR